MSCKNMMTNCIQGCLVADMHGTCRLPWGEGLLGLAPTQEERSPVTGQLLFRGLSARVGIFHGAIVKLCPHSTTGTPQLDFASSPMHMQPVSPWWLNALACCQLVCTTKGGQDRGQSSLCPEAAQDVHVQCATA